MPTTPLGTAWTPNDFTLSGGTKARWYKRDDSTAGNPPVLLFCHGGGGNETTFELHPWTTLRNHVIDAGWVVIEAAGGQHWGHPDGLDRYREAFAHVETVQTLGPLFILGQSMGALAAYNLATKGSLANRHSAVVVCQGTTDLVYRYNRGDAVTVMRNAWGVTEPGLDGFRAVADPHDPMQFDHAVWADKRVRVTWSAQDTQVEPEHHAIPWVAKYGDSTLETTTYINDPGVHTPYPAELTATFNYLSSLITPGPDPEPEPTGPPPTAFYQIAEIRVIV